jgi:hypothetical protein
MHQEEIRFGFTVFYLHANAREQEAWDVTEVGMQATTQLDFLALFTEVPTTHESFVFAGTVVWQQGDMSPVSRYQKALVRCECAASFPYDSSVTSVDR